jgi:hypothetical protein
VRRRPDFMEDMNKVRKRQREWVAKRRQEWFATNGPCKGCGSDKNLELHHADRSTKESHRIFSWAEARRDVELAKCTVLCHECHVIETAAQIKEFRPVHHIHGTQTEYRRGCRCGLCKAAKYLAIKYERMKKQTAVADGGSNPPVSTESILQVL